VNVQAGVESSRLDPLPAPGRAALSLGWLAMQGAVGAGLSSNPPTLSSNPGALSSNLEPQDSNPRHPDQRDDPLADPRRQALLNELPGALAARVGAIGKRHQPQEVQDLVVALCNHRPRQADEIAALLDRNAEAVRQNYLRPLLRAGRIAMTRPDKPNDPDQAYRVPADT
jgi:ATP-dependent DNA helicase RecG